MKLNLLSYVAPPKIEQIKTESLLPSPVGWWRVTTEGDCEGRTTKQLGEHYGHVAEIAFELNHNGGYVLEFHKIEKEKPLEEIPIRQAKTNRINIRVVRPDHRDWSEKDFRMWMDAPELKISGGDYWKSFLLEFKA